LSGSGNSKNILQALRVSRELGLKTYGIYGFDGGQAMGITDEVFHININDM
jgi:D-sedoheptulose 7-phosphate isomerase